MYTVTADNTFRYRFLCVSAGQRFFDCDVFSSTVDRDYSQESYPKTFKLALAVGFFLRFRRTRLAAIAVNNGALKTDTAFPKALADVAILCYSLTNTRGRRWFNALAFHLSLRNIKWLYHFSKKNSPTTNSSQIRIKRFLSSTRRTVVNHSHPLVRRVQW